MSLWTEEANLLLWVVKSSCSHVHNFSIGINSLDVNEASTFTFGRASHSFHCHWMIHFLKMSKVFLVWSAGTSASCVCNPWVTSWHQRICVLFSQVLFHLWKEGDIGLWKSLGIHHVVESSVWFQEGLQMSFWTCGQGWHPMKLAQG